MEAVAICDIVTLILRAHTHTHTLVHAEDVRHRHVWKERKCVLAEICVKNNLLELLNFKTLPPLF